MSIFDGLQQQQRAALGGAFSGAQGLGGGLAGVGQAQASNPFYNHLRKMSEIEHPKKPKTLREELQTETDEWIGDL